MKTSAVVDFLCEIGLMNAPMNFHNIALIGRSKTCLLIIGTLFKLLLKRFRTKNSKSYRSTIIGIMWVGECFNNMG